MLFEKPLSLLLGSLSLLVEAELDVSTGQNKVALQTGSLERVEQRPPLYSTRKIGLPLKDLGVREYGMEITASLALSVFLLFSFSVPSGLLILGEHMLLRTVVH